MLDLVWISEDLDGVPTRLQWKKEMERIVIFVNIGQSITKMTFKICPVSKYSFWILVKIQDQLTKTTHRELTLSKIFI